MTPKDKRRRNTTVCHQTKVYSVGCQGAISLPLILSRDACGSICLRNCGCGGGGAVVLNKSSQNFIENLSNICSMFAQNLAEEHHYLTILHLIGYFNPNLIASVSSYLHATLKAWGRTDQVTHSLNRHSRSRLACCWVMLLNLRMNKSWAKSEITFRIISVGKVDTLSFLIQLHLLCFLRSTDWTFFM